MLMIWKMSGDIHFVGRCRIELLLLYSANPRLGVVSLSLVAGKGADELVSVVVSSLVSPTTQIVETMNVLGNR